MCIKAYGLYLQCGNASALQLGNMIVITVFIPNQ